MGSLQSLFNQQSQFQGKVTGLETPVDNVQWFQYHMTAMNEELGEVLKADKRWKTHRNAHYDPENKLEEIADVFVTAMNIALFSGFDAETIYKAISAKISENTRKFEEAHKNDNNR
ncbi:MAG: dUTP diphosphatase [Clostridia bacterium]|nr:dUTP diphosphatase [Clostridia bacterium]